MMCFVRGGFAHSQKVGLEFIYLPIISGHSEFSIKEAPVSIPENFTLQALLRVMTSPYYVTSARSRRDVNIISLSRIKMSVQEKGEQKSLNYRSEHEILIDTSHLICPKGLDRRDVMQAVLLSLRMFFPVGSIGPINIKITGGRQEDWATLEGPLWKSKN